MFWYELNEYIDAGGTVIVALVLVSGLLWFGLIYRVLLIGKSALTPAEMISRLDQNKSVDGPLAAAAEAAVALAANTSTRAELQSGLRALRLGIQRGFSRYRVLVHTLIAIAPLLGLLGTVDGMIETFRSLGDMTLFSQSGGIAGGISKALLTTQLGLLVSIPGLLLGRMIDRREKVLVAQLYQLSDLISARKV